MIDALVAKGVDSALHQATSQCLPRDGAPVELANATQTLSALQSSNTYRFSDSVAQGKLDLIVKIAFHLLNDNTPALSPEMAKCLVLASALKSIVLFAEHETSVLSTGAGGKTY